MKCWVRHCISCLCLCAQNDTAQVVYLSLGAANAADSPVPHVAAYIIHPFVDDDCRVRYNLIHPKSLDRRSVIYVRVHNHVVLSTRGGGV